MCVANNLHIKPEDERSKLLREKYGLIQREPLLDEPPTEEDIKERVQLLYAVDSLGG